MQGIVVVSCRAHGWKNDKIASVLEKRINTYCRVLIHIAGFGEPDQLMKEEVSAVHVYIFNYELAVIIKKVLLI